MSTLPFGAWKSPLGAAAVAASSLRLQDVCVDGDTVIWVEGRPSEAGRCVVVRHRDGATNDLISAPYSARTGVHEYGGGAIAAADGEVYFVDVKQGAIFRAVEGDTPVAVTTPDAGLRFADMVVDTARNRLVAVAEDHRGDQVINSLKAIDLSTGDISDIAGGHDFFSSPRLSPDGTRLAWITWDFPRMPWDGSDLWVADVDASGVPGEPHHVAGGEAESVLQPRFGPDGTLHYVSDASGWWNVCRENGDISGVAMDCARPHWVFGLSSYAITDDGTVYIAGADNGVWRLLEVTPGAAAPRHLDVPFTEMGAYVHVAGDSLLIDGGSPTQPTGLHLISPATGNVRTIWMAAESPIAEDWISTFESITFPTPDGAEAHAFLYRPTSADTSGPADDLPPLVVRAHGGPTSAARTSLTLDIQYWTTRGFAVCDVNYGGSTGYGRAYRERLRGQTGCVDVDDCVAAAQYLAQRGDVDEQRMAITGGSAGGYIVLCAMVFARDVFAAGTSYFGVTDVEALARDTHKFESRYYDSLIGDYATHASLYHNRSPIHFASRIRTPLLVLQGTDDPIVPLSQAEELVRTLEENGVVHAYIAFPGEQHGFRIAANIARSLEAELSFYATVMNLAPADTLPPLVLQGA